MLLSAALGAAALAGGPPTSTADLLDDLSQRACRFFVEWSGPQTGFALDRTRNHGKPDPDNKVASIATTGFALASYAISAERGWMSREEAVRRARLTLKNVEEKAPKEHGWYYHWLNWKTGQREWESELSTIDSGIFFCGMIVAEQGLKDPEVTQRSERILKAIDWKWVMTDGGTKPNELFISHGWKPEMGFLPSRWGGYCELLLLYVLSYGAYDMPKDSWAKIDRPVVDYKGRQFFVGGSLFLHQMSHVFVDFKNKRDPLGYDYWVSSRNAVLANRQYCIDNPKGFKGYSDKIWGLSASDGPKGYNAYGAPGWIEDDGTLAPSSAVGCVMFAPSEAREAAAAYKATYPKILGTYGFNISFNPTLGWESPDVIGIDLGQMLLSIQNAKDGLVHRLFMSHPLVKRGMQKIGFRTTKEGDATKRPLRVVPR